MHDVEANSEFRKPGGQAVEAPKAETYYHVHTYLHTTTSILRYVRERNIGSPEFHSGAEGEEREVRRPQFRLLTERVNRRARRVQTDYLLINGLEAVRERECVWLLCVREAGYGISATKSKVLLPSLVLHV